MNKEELIGKLHMIYAGDRNALEEMVGYYDGLKQGIKELQQENQSLKKENKILKENSYHNDKVVDKVNWENMLLKKENEQLKDNWNKLKEYTQEKYDNPSWASCGARYVLEKMQELEQGKDD